MTDKSSRHANSTLKDFGYSPLLLQCGPEHYVIKWIAIKQTIKTIVQVGDMCHLAHYGHEQHIGGQRDWLCCSHPQS